MTTDAAPTRTHASTALRASPFPDVASAGRSCDRWMFLSSCSVCDGSNRVTAAVRIHRPVIARSQLRSLCWCAAVKPSMCHNNESDLDACWRRVRLAISKDFLPQPCALSSAQHLSTLHAASGMCNFPGTDSVVDVPSGFSTALRRTRCALETERAGFSVRIALTDGRRTFALLAVICSIIVTAVNTVITLRAAAAELRRR